MKKLTGNEKITGSDLSLIDYWRWAHSDIICNTERAIFAEFLVHSAVNGTEEIRTNWTEYDVHTPDEIKIEVKASGYIQSWEQEKLSTIKFDIEKRVADVFVFCLHKHQERESINILDLSQWTFFIITTSSLNEKVGRQKEISLKRLRRLKAKEVNYSQLGEAIRSEISCENTH